MLKKHLHSIQTCSMKFSKALIAHSWVREINHIPASSNMVVIQLHIALHDLDWLAGWLTVSVKSGRRGNKFSEKDKTPGRQHFSIKVSQVPLPHSANSCDTETRANMPELASDHSPNGQCPKVVLVTGASGFIALHCVQQSLIAGYSVRGTVRTLRNSQKVEPLLRLREKFARQPGQTLELVEADLESAEHWPRVISGCHHILHVASPWPIVADQTTIRTAVEGTMNVLKAAAECPGLERLVLTSSCAAINDGHPNDARVFDEKCWTDLGSARVDDYARSKTLAEKAAWQFWHSLDRGWQRSCATGKMFPFLLPLAANRFQLVVLNPTFVTGPLLSTVPHGSAIIIGRLMNVLTLPAAPKVCLGLVDVRDVARAHLMALEREGVVGQRILITQKRPVWFSDMAGWLRKRFASKGFIISPLVAPNWMVRLWAGLGFDRESKAVVHRLGPELRFDNAKSLNLLGMNSYIEPERSVVEMAESMLELGMLKTTFGKQKPKTKKGKWPMKPIATAGGGSNRKKNCNNANMT